MEPIPRCHACNTVISETSKNEIQFIEKYEKVCKKCFIDLKKCYICGVDLNKIFKNNESWPEMTLYVGTIKKYCITCYKCIKDGEETRRDNIRIKEEELRIAHEKAMQE